MLVPAFPLLEQLRVGFDNEGVAISFPALRHLKSVVCHSCKPLKGLQNLSALTELDLRGCDVFVDVDDAWPSSLRDVAIWFHQSFSPRILDRRLVTTNILHPAA